MIEYKNILVAIDIAKEAEVVLDKAKEIAKKFESRILIVHIVEPIILDYSLDLITSFNVDIEENLIERANVFIKQSIENQDIQNSSFKVLVGSTKYEIQREATDHKVDLIIIGTHGRHGISRLLGSTASAVLHGAPCDVLTVKVG